MLTKISIKIIIINQVYISIRSSLIQTSLQDRVLSNPIEDHCSCSICLAFHIIVSSVPSYRDVKVCTASFMLLYNMIVF